MRDLNMMLREADPALLTVLAKRWSVPGQNLTGDALIEALVHAMLDPAHVEKVYDTLDDKQRGAIQTINGYKDRKMPANLFEAFFGQIRMMGAGRIEREKPHENPASVAEALYYRGVIGKGNDKIGGGIGPVYYIPDDLAKVLPIHKTGYSAAALDEFAASQPPEPGEEVKSAPTTDSAAVGGAAADPQVMPLDEVEDIRQADTSIVDDMTTLLGYLQLYTPAVSATYALDDDTGQKLQPFLLVKDPARLQFMIGVGITAELIEVQSGKAYPRRGEVRRWLAEKRAPQLKWLADAWLKSADYPEVWYTPGLFPEAGWSYDPAEARQQVLILMRQYVPRQEWWAVDDFIDLVKAKNPNFQRPGGDYESWYIRNEAGDYLHGLSSWDAVEGAVLSFYLSGAMHWLGLVDLAEDAVRLTAYGRAVVAADPAVPFPTPNETEDKIVVQPDGTLLASRKVARIDRFQLARFTTWLKPATLTGDPYVYRLDAQGIQRADAQGVNTGHIATFINRIMDGTPVPAAITKMLENWRTGPAAQVSLEQLLVLRTTAPETLDFVFNEPALRRFLGARLGPMAVVVRADQWEALRDALGERGIEMEIIG
jgi:hypothetical protein